LTTLDRFASYTKHTQVHDVLRTSNVPEFVPYLAFVLPRIPLPLTIIQVLAVDLGTEMLPALGPGAEPPDERVMLRSSRARGDRLIDYELLGRAYLLLGVVEAVAAIVVLPFAAVLLLLDGLWKRHRGRANQRISA